MSAAVKVIGILLSFLSVPVYAMNSLQCIRALVTRIPEGQVVSQTLEAPSLPKKIRLPNFIADRQGGFRVIQDDLQRRPNSSEVWGFEAISKKWFNLSYTQIPISIARVDIPATNALLMEMPSLELYTFRSTETTANVYTATMLETTGDKVRRLIPLREDFEDLWQLARMQPKPSKLTLGIVDGESVTVLVAPNYNNGFTLTERPNFTDLTSPRLFLSSLAGIGIDEGLVLVTHVRTLIHLNAVNYQKDDTLTPAEFSFRIFSDDEFEKLEQWLGALRNPAP